MRAVIKGKRITLEKICMKDVDAVTKFCQDPKLSRYTLSIPQPYARKDAVWFVNDSKEKWKSGERYTYTIKDHGELVGMVDLVTRPADMGELGYWIGTPHWGKGYATEAAKLLIREGFKGLKLNRIYSMHETKNPASGRVMQKIGMKYEGLLRQHSKARGKYRDMMYYGILKREYKG